ncbi:MAG TPA: phosphoenolpyruvate carboxykinase (ATP), partial [Bdellovibrionales bacterium]|nr:phosphoenolpyruvate carboxykinase (ATP) [Bdellovibrionales bacterium]
MSSRSEFLADAVKSEGVQVLETGAIAVETGRHTGRSANSRFIVRDERTEQNVDWGDVNKAMAADIGSKFMADLERKLSDMKTYRVRGNIGPFALEVVTPSAWHAMFAENMFRTSSIKSISEAVKSTGISAENPIRIFHDPFTPASQYGITAPEDACILLDP